MSSKDTILESLRRNRPAPAELPDLNHAWTTYDDPRAKFIEVLEAVGGKAIVARDVADLNEQLQKLPQLSTAQKVASLVARRRFAKRRCSRCGFAARVGGCRCRNPSRRIRRRRKRRRLGHRPQYVAASALLPLPTPHLGGAGRRDRRSHARRVRANRGRFAKRPTCHLPSRFSAFSSRALRRRPTSSSRSSSAPTARARSPWCC